MSEDLNLELQFEGFFQCRLATDPDPPSETRGVSGYTFALANESDLDQVIHLQKDEIAACDFREPFPPYLKCESPQFGVFVRQVLRNGVPDPGNVFTGASVRLLRDAKFEIRNQIVADGSNQLIPVIAPFEIDIRGRNGAVLRRFDPLDPAHPDLQIWQLKPEQYERRVPVNFFVTGSEALARILPEKFAGQLDDSTVINGFYNTYFEKRKQWLELEISKLEARRANQGGGDEELELQIESYRTRLFAIEQNTIGGGPNNPGRMENRLGLQTVWKHDIVGEAQVEGIPFGTVQADRPWHTRFWIGGWDGDLLVGYLKGCLQVPFVCD